MLTDGVAAGAEIMRPINVNAMRDEGQVLEGERKATSLSCVSTARFVYIFKWQLKWQHVSFSFELVDGMMILQLAAFPVHPSNIAPPRSSRHAFMRL